MQHLFNFERLNRNLMYNEYFRQVSFFEGSEYASPDLESYDFDPTMARDYLRRAGYRRPVSVTDPTLFGRITNTLHGLLFTRSDSDDILVNDRGQPASFTVIYGTRGLERHLTVMQQEYRRAGVDMRLQLLEPGTAFERGLERKYEMTLTGRTTDFYPDPRQYLHTDFKSTTNNNNIWGFGRPDVDALIRIYDESLDPDDRLAAMHRIDEIVHDEAFYIPFWDAPFVRIVHWDYLQFPESYLPRRLLRGLPEWPVFWIDEGRRTAVERAMASGEAFPVSEETDVDYYNVRGRAD
jgi:microcin C transport system substrate-binding protein